MQLKFKNIKTEFEVYSYTICRVLYKSLNKVNAYKKHLQRFSPSYRLFDRSMYGWCIINLIFFKIIHTYIRNQSSLTIHRMMGLNGQGLVEPCLKNLKKIKYIHNQNK